MQLIAIGDSEFGGHVLLDFILAQMVLSFVFATSLRAYEPWKSTISYGIVESVQYRDRALVLCIS